MVPSGTMAIPIFLSYPKPHLQYQADLVDAVREYLTSRGLEARTLGVTEYDNDAPLTAIRRLMLESNGLITIAFRRLWIEKGASRQGADISGQHSTKLEDIWLTSPFTKRVSSSLVMRTATDGSIWSMT